MSSVDESRRLTMKRKSGGSSESSGEDDPEVEAENESSQWEDQDSSEGENEKRLRIHEPKKKKIRKTRSLERVSPRKGDVQIPEDVLSECSKLLAMDKRLDEKAKRHNWGRKQVKTVLRAIVQSEEMMNMLRHAGLATGEKEPTVEPKMTRATIRKVVSAGHTVPWIVEPATQVRVPDPEVAWLAGDLQDEEEDDRDPEYNPYMDSSNLSEDDDTIFASEDGTPSRSYCQDSQDSRQTSTPVTPTSRPTPNDSSQEFKRPFRSLAGTSRALDFDSTSPVRSEGYSMRKTNPLIDRELGDIEQELIPFDITEDMYEPVSYEPDDWGDFIKELCGVSGVGEYNEVEDQDFVFNPDEFDKRIKDPEEWRYERATIVPKTELEVLISDLGKSAEDACRMDEDSKKEKVYKKKKSRLPGEVIFEEIKEAVHVKEVPVKEKDKIEETPFEYFEVVEFTDDQRDALALQMSQHIQLLTQIALLSSYNPMWSGVKTQCHSMLGEIVSSSLLTAGSVSAQSNLLTSLSVIEQWDQNGEDPTAVIKNRNSKKYKKRPNNYELSDSLTKFMAHQSVFYFPALLPTSGLSQDHSRTTWTPGEDHLLAQALAATMPTLTKNGLTELSFAAQARFMKAKSAVQIRARVKNLKIREKDEGDHPVLQFIKTRQVSCTKVEINNVSNGSETLVDMVKSGKCEDFPPLWLGVIHKILQKRSSGDQPRKLEPFPVLRNPTPIQFQHVIIVPPPMLPVAEERCAPISPPISLQPILCVDGQTGTPSASSTSEGEDAVPPPPSIKSPIKRLIHSRPLSYKSPIKAASERILRKYSTSPHKRPRPILPARYKRRPPSGGQSPPPAPVIQATSPPRSPPRNSPPPQEEGGTDMVDSADTPTTLARRKTRHQKEAELTLALLGTLETPDEKETRLARESQDLSDEINRALGDCQELKEKYLSIMGAAEMTGVVNTYTALHSLLTGHQAVQEALLDLLSDSEAYSLGTAVYEAHQHRAKMKQFVIRLGLAYKHQPAYHARVLRELDTLCSDPGLSPDLLRSAATRLFKHNQFLLDQFILLVPGVEPPENYLPSPEVLAYPDDSDHSVEGEDLCVETIHVPRSPEREEDRRNKHSA